MAILGSKHNEKMGTTETLFHNQLIQKFLQHKEYILTSEQK